MNRSRVRVVELTIEQKKEFLISRGEYSRCEFGFFDQLPEHVQNTYLDIAMRAYEWRQAKIGKAA